MICVYPAYPAPETLDVDISFNGLDWSNDHVKFSYIDPFVLGVRPRLVSPRGTTKLWIYGYGMGNSTADEQMIGFKNYPAGKMCKSGGKDAIKPYHVHNENLVDVGSFSQSELECDGKNIGFDAWIVSIMNPEGAFDPNDIYIYYYAEPNYKKMSS